MATTAGSSRNSLSLGPLDGRFYTEDEIQLECQGRYNQETLSFTSSTSSSSNISFPHNNRHVVFHDSTSCDQEESVPQRYLTQWSLKIPNQWMYPTQTNQETLLEYLEKRRGASCVPLPPHDEFRTNTSPSYYSHAYLEGTLLPRNHEEAPPIRVRLSALSYVTTSRSRGHGVMTQPSPHRACYWLQEPSNDMREVHLEKRAQWGLLVNVYDALQTLQRLNDNPHYQDDHDDDDDNSGIDAWNWLLDQSPASLRQLLLPQGLNNTEEPFSLELMNRYGRAIRNHLLQWCHPHLTRRSTLYREMGEETFNEFSREQLTRWCEQAEARAQQSVWTTEGPSSSTICNVFTEAILQDQEPTNAPHQDNDHEQEEPDWNAIAQVAQSLKQTQRYKAARQPKNRRLDNPPGPPTPPSEAVVNTAVSFDTIKHQRLLPLAVEEDPPLMVRRTSISSSRSNKSRSESVQPFVELEPRQVNFWQPAKDPPAPSSSARTKPKPRIKSVSKPRRYRSKRTLQDPRKVLKNVTFDDLEKMGAVKALDICRAIGAPCPNSRLGRIQSVREALQKLEREKQGEAVVPTEEQPQQQGVVVVTQHEQEQPKQEEAAVAVASLGSLD